MHYKHFNVPPPDLGKNFFIFKKDFGNYFSKVAISNDTDKI